MSAIHVIKVPDVGEGVAEVELVAWHVQPGDTVIEDQALADVMTDKASVEIPSPVAGRVIALGGTVGQTLAVGSELIRIELAAGAAAPATAAGPKPMAASAAAPIPSPASAPAPSMPAPIVAPPPARPAPPATRAAASGASAASPPGERPIASPALRRRAWEHGVDLAALQPSGPGGRILQADLDAYLATRGAAPPAAATAAPAPAARREDQAVPVIGLRRRIALQMQEAKRRIPHFSYVEEVDVSELETLRAALNERHGATRGRLTMLPLLVRGIVLALRDFAQINATFDDEAGVVTRHGAVHMGVATQTPHGLMVPVLRHAEARTPWEMAAEVQRLAEAARGGRATRDELRGSTITISSLGALGGIVSTPVINRPEVAIVAVNRIVERPVLRGGMVVARSLMNLSSSFDHRVVDGMDAARFVQALRALLECPALLFVE